MPDRNPTRPNRFLFAICGSASVTSFCANLLTTHPPYYPLYLPPYQAPYLQYSSPISEPNLCTKLPNSLPTDHPAILQPNYAPTYPTTSLPTNHSALSTDLPLSRPPRYHLPWKPFYLPPIPSYSFSGDLLKHEKICVSDNGFRDIGTGFFVCGGSIVIFLHEQNFRLFCKNERIKKNVLEISTNTKLKRLHNIISQL